MFRMYSKYTHTHTTSRYIRHLSVFTIQYTYYILIVLYGDDVIVRKTMSSCIYQSPLSPLPPLPPSPHIHSISTSSSALMLSRQQSVDCISSLSSYSRLKICALSLGVESLFTEISTANNTHTKKEGNLDQ